MATGRNIAATQGAREYPNQDGEFPGRLGVCPGPILKGAYEHFELKSITVIGTMFGLFGERRTPDLDEYVGGGGCQGTRRVQGQVREEQLLVPLPPEFFTGPTPKGQAMRQQEQEWTWTFTRIP